MEFKLLKGKAVFQIVVLIVAMVSFGVFMGSVDVGAVNYVCCENTVDGESCKFTDEGNCAPGSQANTACESTAFCQVGCCVDGVSGVCSYSVPRTTCENDGGVWDLDASCGIDECKQGCCAIGNSCDLRTQQECMDEASSYPELEGVSVWFAYADNTMSCDAVCDAQETGCCVDFVGGCDFTTRGMCASEPFTQQDGSLGFYEGVICSDESLNCDCDAQSYKGCLPAGDGSGDGSGGVSDGDDEDVYWFDSCGNVEGVAEDCDYFQDETKCGFDEFGGEAYCKSLNCEVTQEFFNENGVDMNPDSELIGGFRYNGESWCSYESGVGNYLDRPGTRHYLHSCVEGEEKITGCRDKREEVCLDWMVTYNSTGRTMQYGECVDNEIYDSIFNTTMTTVAKGSDFWLGAGEADCQEGTVSCTVVWAKRNSLDDWDCEENCECEEQGWVDDALIYCKSFGDCGADVNVFGEKSKVGVEVNWQGTSRGGHPQDVPDALLESWDVYGIFGGMLGLREAFQSSTGVAGNALAEWGEVAGFTSSVFGVAAAVAGLAASYGAFGLFLFETFPWAFVEGGIAFGPLGWILAVVGIVLSLILGGGEIRTKTVTVECHQWQPPAGGENCERCEEDSRYGEEVYGEPVECSEYRCRSLGAACGLVGDGTADEKCTWLNPEDFDEPVISPNYDILSGGFNIVEISGAPIGAYRIEPLIDAYNPISFGIKTDELALCKYGHISTGSYEEMVPSFGVPIYSLEHDFIDVSFAGGREFVFYVRCIDVNGHSNTAEYVVELGTKDEPDLSVPNILNAQPISGSYVPFDAEDQDVILFLNEPSRRCRWDYVDEGYDGMNESNVFGCGYDVGFNETVQEALDDFSGIFFESSFPCYGRIGGLENNQENNRYIACLDIVGNNHTEGILYTLMGSSEFYISSVEPSGKLYTNEIELKVQTFGGAEAGKSLCRYDLQSGAGGWNDFDLTGESVHVQYLELPLGDYKYDVECEDIGGNVESDVIEFEVEVDFDAPWIENVYVEGANLFVITNENSICEYSVEDAYFDFGDGGEMSGVMTEMHSVLIEENIYYVRCYDAFNNMREMITVFTNML